MCSGWTSNMSARADPGPSWWLPSLQNENRSSPMWRLQKENCQGFLFFLFSFPSLEIVGVSFGFGQFALLLSVSHSAWPTAVCSNYMLGEGWPSVTVYPTVSVWTRPDVAQWEFYWHTVLKLWLRDPQESLERLQKSCWEKMKWERLAKWAEVTPVWPVVEKHLCLTVQWCVFQAATGFVLL